MTYDYFIILIKNESALINPVSGLGQLACDFSRQVPRGQFINQDESIRDVSSRGLREP